MNELDIVADPKPRPKDGVVLVAEVGGTGAKSDEVAETELSDGSVSVDRAFGVKLTSSSLRVSALL